MKGECQIEPVNQVTKKTGFFQIIIKWCVVDMQHDKQDILYNHNAVFSSHSWARQHCLDRTAEQMTLLYPECSSSSPIKKNLQKSFARGHLFGASV